MNDEDALHDAGFDDTGPFSVTPEPGGMALDTALRDFGPAAFDDLIPRLRSLAADLDAAHDGGFVHGRLHPSKVIVTADATFLMGRPVSQAASGGLRWPVLAPYAAPEVVRGGAPSPMSDQFSLAAIAHEWMFGRPITGPAERPLDVRTVPGVDRQALASAFTRALAPEPFRRYASCVDFCDALAAAQVPTLPLLAADDERETPVAPLAADLTLALDDVRDLDDEVRETVPSGTRFTAEIDDEPDLRLTADDPPAAPPMAPPVVAAVPAWQPSAVVERPAARFGGMALIAAALVGMVVGFAAGYMARPRALQYATAPDTRIELDVSGATDAPAAQAAPTAPAAPAAQSAPAAPERGSILVRSTPSGATVSVDGVPRGETPLALRDLDLGARDLIVSQRGFVPEERRVVLTEARPSRTVDVRLTAMAASAPRPSTPATLGQPAGGSGALVVESIPAGAAVTINGKPSGKTPLTLADLPAGEYRVTINMVGYRDIATTVRVVAGERARAAARLTEQEQE